MMKMNNGTTRCRKASRGLRRALCGLAAASAFGAAPALFALDVTLDDDTRYQTIDGWGTCLVSWGDLASEDSLYLKPGFMQAYARDLGFNILRVAMDPGVLTGPAGRYDDPVRLGPSLDENIAKMDFNHSRVWIFGQVAQNLKAQALEPERVKFMCDYWSPPHWLKAPTGGEAPFVDKGPPRPTPYVTEGNTDTVGGRLKAEDPEVLEQFGRFIAASSEGFARHYGIEFDNLSFSNEVSFENPFTSCVYHVKPGPDTDGDGDADPERGHEEQYALALDAIRQTFRQQGIDTKLRGPHMANMGEKPDNPWALNQQMQFVNAIKDYEDPTLIDFLWSYTGNGYDTAEHGAKMWNAFLEGKDAMPGEPFSEWLVTPGVAGDDKPYWVAEAGGEDAQWLQDGRPGNGAITLAQKLHNALVWGDVNAYIYWQAMDEGSGQPGSHALFTGDFDTSNKKASAFKHYSRYIRPGAVRISATPTSSAPKEFETSQGVNVSAYVHEKDGTLTVVLLNMTEKAEPVTISLGDLNVQSFDAYRTSESESFQQLAGVPVQGDNATLEMPAYSAVTLHGKLN